VLARALTAFVLSLFAGQKLVGILAKITKADLTLLRELMASGKVTPVIDRRYSLRAVPEAIRYMEAGHARGKVVIAVDSSQS
jgi:D-arabinose 1-dehydrogenase-like Zn-dependent alcohol dehydrogenase